MIKQTTLFYLGSPFRVISVAAIGAMLLLGACTLGEQDVVTAIDVVGNPGPAATIGIAQTAFEPTAVTISVGETVEWRNEGFTTHTVTSDPNLVTKRANVSTPPGAPSFHSGDLNRGQSFSYTFTFAGTYRYVSLTRESSGMAGTIVVTK